MRHRETEMRLRGSRQSRPAGPWLVAAALLFALVPALVPANASAQVVAARGAAAQVVIDEFSTAQTTVSDPPGGTSTAATGGPDILGGKRGLVVRRLAGPGPVNAGVASGALELTVSDTTPSSVGEALLIWDGDADDDAGTFDPTGLGSVDLTVGGALGGLRLVVEQAEAGTHLIVTIYEDADHVSRAGRVLPAIASTQAVVVSFSELVAAPGALGPADLSQVGAITLRLGGPEVATPPTVRISHFEAAASAVAALKVDLASGGGPIPPGGVNPGDTIRYRITIREPGGGAEGVDLEDVLETNLGLVAGSVRTSPLARRDQYWTVTDTPVDSAVAGLPALLDNDSDPDGNALAAVAATSQATSQGGSVDIDTAGDFIYTPPAGFQGVDAFTYTLGATAGDPTTDASGNPIVLAGTAYVVIDRVPPVVTAGGTLAYTEDDPPTAIDTTITVTDSDSVNLVGATAEISANYVMGEDVLSFVNTPNITGVFVPGTGTLTLSGTDTVGNYQAALRAVRYENTSEAPSTLSRTVTWTATDGVETSVAVTSTIEVTSVNDPPVVTTTVGSTSFTEDGGAVVVDNLVSVTDADDANLESATISLASAPDGATETLGVNSPGTNCPGLAVTAGNPLTIGNSAAKATYQTCLRNVTYNNTSQDPNTAGRTVNFVVNDGDINSSPASKTVTVTAVNDPPVAGDDAWDSVGNTQLVVDLAALPLPHVRDTTGSGLGVRDNDSDPVEGDNHAVSGIVGCGDLTAPFGDVPTCATANGGSVVINANGTFTYTPANGVPAASDSFQYTLTDDGTPTPASDTATVTINRFERVWYVKNNAAAGGLGRSHDPFDTLAEAEVASVANDWIFVHFGDGTTAGQNAGIALKASQHLVGEHAGLSIPVNLNANGSPAQLFAAVPGNRPLIDHSGAGNNAISATDVIPIEIVGLSLMSVNANAIDVTLAGAFGGTGTLTIRDNLVRGAGAEGVDVNAGGTGALTLAVQGNSWNVAGTHTGNAVDVARTAGTLNLNFSGNTNIKSNVAAVVVSGGAAASSTITGFAGNSIHGDTLGGGVAISGVTFDAVSGGAVQQVDGDNLMIGAFGNPVGGAGMSLTNVLGNLFFDDLDAYAGTSGLTINGAMSFAVTPASPDGSGTSTIDADNGAAVDVTSATIDLRLDDLESSTPGSGVNLNTVGGQFRAPSGSSIAKSSGGGTAFSVATSSATVNYAGTLSATSGSGVGLSNNTGAVNFTGQLILNTGANPAFSATGSNGTVTATHASNTLVTTSATALNVNGPDIGSGGLVFQSISANGAANGIVLKDTGTTAGLTVSGTGSAGSGGTIQNVTGDAVRLDNTRNIQLSFMNISNVATTAGATCTFQNASDCSSGIDMVGGTQNVTIDDVVINGSGQIGISAKDVTGLTITDSQVLNAGNANDEYGVLLDNLAGTVLLEDVTIDEPQEGGVRLYKSAGAALGMTLRRVIITDNDLVDGEDGFQLEVEGTGSATIDVDDCTMQRVQRDGVDAIVEGVAGAVLNLTVRNGDFLDNAGLGGVIVASGNTATARVTVDNNLFEDTVSTAITMVQTVDSTMNVIIEDNTIRHPTPPATQIGFGIRLSQEEDGDMTARVERNTISGTGFDGLRAFSRLGDFPGLDGDTGTLHVTVRDNNIAAPLNVTFGADIQAQNAENLVCLAIQDVAPPGNNVFNGNGAAGIRVREVVAAATFQVEGLTPLGDRPPAQMQNFLDANNTNNPASLASPAGSFYTGVAAGTCRVPVATPLP